MSTAAATLYTRTDPALGEFAVRPLDLNTDAAVLHAWVTHPKAAFWMMQGLSVDEVTAAYRRVAEHPHHEAFLGLWQGEPAFLLERYDPARAELVGLYPAQPGDVGMHFLCPAAARPVHGFTLAVITTVVAFVLDDPAARRVVVEPDLRNTAVHALNAAVGFVPAGPISKPEKEALLSFCTREQFLAATTGARG
ncbi:GNAT family N-acetyltransferase [Streptomyces tateyamensis]|uniref:Lysine N-acyltransferase MbtK n=1 Tax=Streptomyces tateyamensis TaxID=565073 RepID=A0A2V4PSW1_9ACTN|nr:GNAT family N-acetyltransferase [Streptomyces tateyamensis]PYC88209.1 GNAT family N-acetyltransferase [Streptomyces tateyamensis]